MNNSKQAHPLPNGRPDPALSRLLRDGTPFLDVRAPQEFLRGALPASVNLPILDDDERAHVGTTYKQHGPAAAVALGHRLVSGAVKAGRVEGWGAFLRANPNSHVMCWRGGQRSAIAQTWLGELGFDVPRVPGGYKALRHSCLASLNQAAASKLDWWVIAGRTGSRKTVLIQSLPQAIDLEGLAQHRGSAFGALASPQPTPATFENALAVAWLQHPGACLVLEDESRTIGRLALPETWHARMQQAPLAVIECTLDARVAHIESEYVTQPLAEGVDPEALLATYQDALRRIARRLGGARHRMILERLHAAFDRGATHAEWIGLLLKEYYDPMYDYQLEGKRQRIRFSGTFAEVQAWLSAL